MSTILITGASSGLGAEMARQFAAKGHDLALCARRTDRLEELRDEILAVQPGRRVELRALDVNDDAQVFEVFRAFRDDLGGLDRVVVNAGLGKGAPLGTGHHGVNRETAMTNFVAALAQAEAAMEIFRAQGTGHLVLVSSMSAMRGMPKSMTVYAATKAGVSALAEGIRSDLWDTPIRVTAVQPGYVRTSLAGQFPNLLFTSGLERGTRAVVRAIEREPARAHVPAWPWAGLAWPMRLAPLGLYRRIAG